MVESHYALRKFVESVGDKKKIKLLINIETSSAQKFKYINQNISKC